MPKSPDVAPMNYTICRFLKLSMKWKKVSEWMGKMQQNYLGKVLIKWSENFFGLSVWVTNFLLSLGRSKSVFFQYVLQYLVRRFEKQSIPQDAAWETLQFAKEKSCYLMLFVFKTNKILWEQFLTLQKFIFFFSRLMPCFYHLIVFVKINENIFFSPLCIAIA